MIKVLESIISKIKGYDYRLDEQINTVDLFTILLDRTIKLIRGSITKILIKKCGKFFFMGKNSKIICKRKITIGNGVTFGKNVEVNALSRNGVKIGSNVNIGDYSVIRCTGILTKLGTGLTIGDNSSLGDYCFIGAAGGVKIGNNVIMGQNVRFHSENHNYDRLDIPIRNQGTSHKGITIGNDCWIGAGVVFLDGVDVGNGCVIGANSVITKDIKDYSVVAGAPAKIIKMRN